MLENNQPILVPSNIYLYGRQLYIEGDINREDDRTLEVIHRKLLDLLDANKNIFFEEKDYQKYTVKDNI